MLVRFRLILILALCLTLTSCSMMPSANPQGTTIGKEPLTTSSKPSAGGTQPQTRPDPPTTVAITPSVTPAVSHPANGPTTFPSWPAKSWDGQSVWQPGNEQTLMDAIKRYREDIKVWYEKSPLYDEGIKGLQGKDTLFGIPNATASAAVGSQEKDQASSMRSDYSRTNTQVAGIDEADAIQTDGQYLYLLRNGRLTVVKAADPTRLQIIWSERPADETDLMARDQERIIEMYLDRTNKRLIVLSSGIQVIEETLKPLPSDAGKPDPRSSTQPSERPQPTVPRLRTVDYASARIYDVADPTHPQLLRRHLQEGGYQTSRLIDDRLILISTRFDERIQQSNDEEGPLDLFPKYSPNGLVGNWKRISPRNLTILPNANLAVQTCVVSLDTGSGATEIRVIAGGGGIIYCSPNYLYVANGNNPMSFIPASRDHQTSIYRFSLNDPAISLNGTASVPGFLNNPFSMDESAGYLRIATTTLGNRDDQPSANHLFILDEKLGAVGQVTNLAPGETIQSVRFLGDVAHVVTFRQVDPLFVIDLSKADQPKVLGQLKIPGFSTYLHPYDDRLLLGFGYDVEADGNMALTRGIKVSVFDVSDLSKPREISSLVFGGRGSEAGLLQNHRELLFNKEKNLIAFPALLRMDDAHRDSVPFQGLLVLRMNGGTLELAGGITHMKDKPYGDEDIPYKRGGLAKGHADRTDGRADAGKTAATVNPINSDNALRLAAGETSDFVYRAAYIGDVLYTVSRGTLLASDAHTLVPLGQVALPGLNDVETDFYGYRGWIE